MGDIPITEPLIHSHYTDVLEDTHPLAWKNIACDRCGNMIHASNNECMQTWIEWGDRNICGECFAGFLTNNQGVLEWPEFVTYCIEPRSEDQ